MRKQLQILLAGALVVVPLAVTVWVIWWIGGEINALGTRLLQTAWPDAKVPPGVGILIVLVLLYLAGLLARSWLFGWVFRLLDRLLASLPGVKTVYESVRDLLNLFGGDAGKMGKVVLYRQPGTDIILLGIMTNENPAGVNDNLTEGRVALYQPFSYMFGGPTIYVPADHVQEIDLSVDQALKLATTAHVGAVARKLDAEPTADAPGAKDKTDPPK